MDEISFGKARIILLPALLGLIIIFFLKIFSIKVSFWISLLAVIIVIVLIVFSRAQTPSTPATLSGLASRIKTIKLTNVAIAIILVLVVIVGIWLISGDSKEKTEGDFFRISNEDVDATIRKGPNWIKIQGREKQSNLSIVSHHTGNFEVSFDYKGDPNASFQIKVYDLNAPFKEEGEVVNFSDGKYKKNYKEWEGKEIEIILKIVVPPGATVEITNFKVVSA